MENFSAVEWQEAPLETYISHELDLAPLELKVQPWFKGFKIIKLYRRWEYTREALRLNLFLDRLENPWIKATTALVTLSNCVLKPKDKFWVFTFKKTEKGTLELRCNGNQHASTVCGTEWYSCAYSLFDIDRFTLAKDFGQGKVHYVQHSTGETNISDTAFVSQRCIYQGWNYDSYTEM